MGYVGNSPAEKYASFAVQHFTTSATTGYTLDHAVTNENDIRLVINNVIQQPGSSYAYTASGTTLTLSAATAGTDTMYCVFLGKAVQTVVPPAGSVTESTIGASNSPTNGYVLSAQSGAAGGLTWAADAAGTITAFTNGVDNRLVTATSATALNGEADLTYDGTTFQLSQASPIFKVLPTTNGNSGVVEICGRATDGSPTENRTQIKGTPEGSTANTEMTFHVENASGVNERMKITSDGRVGIGQSSPDAFLQVDHSEAAVNSARIRNSNSDISAGLLRVDATADPGGSYRLAEFCRESNTKLEIQNDGDVNNQNGTYGTISDIRVKENIVDANSQWDDIKALKIKNYNLKIDANAPKQLGVIAQDLEASGMNGLIKETKPEKHHADIDSVFGSVDSEGNFTEGEMVKTVKTSILYMKAIKALQEAQTRIETLETKVATLESA